MSLTASDAAAVTPPRTDTDRLADRVGITRDHARVLHVLFTRNLRKYNGWRSPIGTAQRVVLALAAMEYIGPDGVTPSPFHDQPDVLSTSNIRDPKRVMGQLGIMPVDIDKACKRARQRTPHAPTADLDLVLAFYPEPLWRVYAWLLSLGSLRASSYLTQWAENECDRTLTRSTYQRDAGDVIAPNTVMTRWGSMRGLFKHVCALAQNPDFDHSGLLDDWVVLPAANTPDELSKVNRYKTTTDRTAPPLPEFRAGIKLVDRQLADIPTNAKRRSASIGKQRRRLVAAFAGGLGLRKDAMARLILDSFKPTHKWDDGTYSSALVVFPWKGADLDDARAKYLAPEVVNWCWLLFEAVGWADIDMNDDGSWKVHEGLTGHRDAHLNGTFVARLTAPGSTQFWPISFEQYTKPGGATAQVRRNGKPVPNVGMDPMRIEQALDRAVRRTSGERAVTPPLVPILNDSQRADEAARQLAPGYSLHQFRHLAGALASGAMMELVRDDHRLYGWTPDDGMDAFLDHAFTAVNDAYQDREAKRDWVTRELGKLVWSWVWGEAGARRGPDIAARVEARSQLARADVVLGQAQAADDQVAQRQAQLAADAMGSDLSKLTDREVTELTHRLLGSMELLRLERERTTSKLVGAKVERERAADAYALAQDRTVALDDLDDPADVFKLAASLDAEQATVDAGGTLPQLQRGTISLREAGWVFDVSQATISRWTSGTLVSNAPWDADSIPVERVGRQRKVVRFFDLEGEGRTTVDPSRVPPDVMERARMVLEGRKIV